MCSFLETLFVEFPGNMGCLRESPQAEKDRCYLNTNFIALEVLKLCNSSLVAPIQNLLNQYDSTLWDGKNRLRILLLKSIPLPPRKVTRVLLDTKTSTSNETIKIYVDYMVNDIEADWYNYADLIVLSALEKLRRNDFSGAASDRDLATRLWVGKGFGDKVYLETGLFETYKLSLYYFLARARRNIDYIAQWIESNIDSFIVSGGVITHYNNNLIPTGDPNVESTAITALAFHSTYPVMFPVFTARAFEDPLKPLAQLINSTVNLVAALGMINIFVINVERQKKR